MTDTATSLPFTLSNHDESPTQGGSLLATMPCYGSLDLRLADCMDVMKGFDDGHFDLAIVDPPYGIGQAGGEMHSNRSLNGAGKLKNRILNTGNTKWDTAPSPEYFTELRRVSKHQIIWGGNYFPLPPTRCVISWDKEQPWPNFSAWEMAWTSFDKPAKLFRWNNQGSGGAGKIHPTQKPVALYKWLLATFAGNGQRVLDTHLGSGSIAIACHYAGINLTACEIAADYYEAAMARIARETSQTELFSSHNTPILPQ